jgi:hypothetical protein
VLCAFQQGPALCARNAGEGRDKLEERGRQLIDLHSTVTVLRLFEHSLSSGSSSWQATAEPVLHSRGQLPEG